MYERKESMGSSKSLIQPDLYLKYLRRKCRCLTGDTISMFEDTVFQINTSDYPKSTNELRRLRFKKNIIIMKDHTIFSFFLFFIHCEKVLSCNFSKTKVWKETSTAHTCQGISKPDHPCPASPGFPPTLPMAQDPISAQSITITPCSSNAIGVPEPIPVPELLSAFSHWTTNLTCYLTFTWWSLDSWQELFLCSPALCCPGSWPLSTPNALGEQPSSCCSLTLCV